MTDPGDRSQFATLIGGLAISTGREADTLLLRAYWMGLEDLPIEAVKFATGRALRECKFMPSVAELRELAGVAKPEDLAVIAWDHFQRAVSRHGSYKSVQFDDPAINATVRNLGGWEHVCELPADEFDKWLRKDFERVYASLVRSGAGLEQSGYLIGTFERENAKLGQPIEPPVMIETGLATAARITNTKPAGVPLVSLKRA